MGIRVKIKTEWTAADLHERYRQSSEPVERTHWHILWLMKDGHTPDQIAQDIGYTARWVRTIVHRFNEQGEQGMGNHRLTLPGATPLLTPEQQHALQQALEEPPEDEGLWNGPKVAIWMQERLGRPVDPRRGWEYLRRLGYSTRVPRRQHAQADPVSQEAFKKTARRGARASTTSSTGQDRTVE